MTCFVLKRAGCVEDNSEIIHGAVQDIRPSKNGLPDFTFVVYIYMLHNQTITIERYQGLSRVVSH